MQSMEILQASSSNLVMTFHLFDLWPRVARGWENDNWLALQLLISGKGEVFQSLNTPTDKVLESTHTHTHTRMDMHLLLTGTWPPFRLCYRPPIHSHKYVFDWCAFCHYLSRSMLQGLFLMLTLYSSVSFLSISLFEEFFEDEKSYVKCEALTQLTLQTNKVKVMKS